MSPSSIQRQLDQACQSENIALARQALDQGASPFLGSPSPIHVAASRGHGEMLFLFFERHRQHLGLPELEPALVFQRKFPSLFGYPRPPG